MIKLLSEEQVLELDFRVQVIKQITSDGNARRKREAQKRHEIYKDNTVKYVMEKMKKEGLKDETLSIMSNRAANISICRKVVNKLARCYKGGVQRTTGSEVADIQVTEMAKLLDFDQHMKKTDRYCQLQKNAMPMPMPELVRIDRMTGKKIFRLKIRVMSPQDYDVLPSAKDCEQAGALILSDFSDVLDGKGRFIWWTDNFHFTTDEKGQIVYSQTPEDMRNPIGMIPGTTVAEDQDGSYWAEGGQDLTDGSVLVNTLLTDMFAIAYMQGWGQLVISGKKIPQSYQVGPHTALILEYEDGDPKPEVQVVNPNPPLDAWMSSIEQYVALLLSTNNLSPSNMSVKLDAQNAASGIALLVEKSEATGSVEDRQSKFRAAERRMWEVIKRWHNILFETQALDEEFMAIDRIPEEVNVSINFKDTKEVVTEKERLENIKLRQEIGLNTELELLMIDRPGLTKEDAEKLLLEIKKDRVENAHKAAAKTADEMNKGDDDGDETDNGGDKERSDEG